MTRLSKRCRLQVLAISNRMLKSPKESGITRKAAVLGTVLSFFNACAEDAIPGKVPAIEADAGPNDIGHRIGRDINGQVGEVTKPDAKPAVCTKDLFQVSPQCGKPLPPIPEIDPCTIDGQAELEQASKTTQEVLDNIDCLLSKQNTEIGRVLKDNEEAIIIRTDRGIIRFYKGKYPSSTNIKPDIVAAQESVVFNSDNEKNAGKYPQDLLFEFEVRRNLKDDELEFMTGGIDNNLGGCHDSRDSVIEGPGDLPDKGTFVRSTKRFFSSNPSDKCKLGQTKNVTCQANGASYTTMCFQPGVMGNYMATKRVKIPDESGDQVAKKLFQELRALRKKHDIKFKGE